MVSGRRYWALAVLLFCFAGPASASEARCPSLGVAVDTDARDLSRRICEVAERAVAMLETCGVSMDRHISISVTRDWGYGCTGVYHCGEDRIELPHPEVLATIRSEVGAFAGLSTMAYFDSLVVHELAHAALDGMPCPFEACVVTEEVVAYVMQVRSLGTEDRASFEKHSPQATRVSKGSLNEILLGMSPTVFARRAWSYVQQQAAPCDYVRDISRGLIIFDRERF